MSERKPKDKSERLYAIEKQILETQEMVELDIDSMSKSGCRSMDLRRVMMDQRTLLQKLDLQAICHGAFLRTSHLISTEI